MFFCLCVFVPTLLGPETSGKEILKFSASSSSSQVSFCSSNSPLNNMSRSWRSVPWREVFLLLGTFFRQPNGNPSKRVWVVLLGKAWEGWAICFRSDNTPTCSKTPRRKWGKPIPISIIATRRCRTGNCQQTLGCSWGGFFQNLEVKKFLERVNLKQVQKKVMWWIFGQFRFGWLDFELAAWEFVSNSKISCQDEFEGTISKEYEKNSKLLDARRSVNLHGVYQRQNLVLVGGGYKGFFADFSTGFFLFFIRFGAVAPWILCCFCRGSRMNTHQSKRCIGRAKFASKLGATSGVAKPSGWIREWQVQGREGANCRQVWELQTL